MKKYHFLLIVCIGLFSCNKPEPQTNSGLNQTDQFVFQTDSLKRYSFPTHINDLVIDRYKSSVSEVFMVIVEPGKSVMHHKHDDTEQVFYMIRGTGYLCLGPEKKEQYVKPGDVIRIPPSTLHSIKTDTEVPIKYLCVDCFTQKPLEPTWDEHVKVVCKNNGWDFSEVTGEK